MFFRKSAYTEIVVRSCKNLVGNINRNNPQILPYREMDAGAELKLRCELEWPKRHTEVMN